MFLLQALDLSNTEDMVNRKILLLYLHNTYVRLNKTDEAIDVFNEYDSLSVTINNQNVQYTISDIETGYETEKKI